MSAFAGVVLFTIVEVGILVTWLILAGLPFNGQYEAVAVLAVGLLVEHVIAFNVSAGRSILKLPRLPETPRWSDPSVEGLRRHDRPIA